jgi:hypothetical protein
LVTWPCFHPNPPTRSPVKLYYHARKWSLLLPSPLAVSSCYSCILIAICRQVTGSPDPAPVHALSVRCSDVTTSSPGLGANEITAVS